MPRYIKKTKKQLNIKKTIFNKKTHKNIKKTNKYKKNKVNKKSIHKKNLTSLHKNNNVYINNHNHNHKGGAGYLQRVSQAVCTAGRKCIEAAHVVKDVVSTASSVLNIVVNQSIISQLNEIYKSTNRLNSITQFLLKFFKIQKIEISTLNHNISDEVINCASKLNNVCLSYYQQNNTVPLLNLQKIFLSIYPKISLKNTDLINYINYLSLLDLFFIIDNNKITIFTVLVNNILTNNDTLTLENIDFLLLTLIMIMNCPNEAPNNDNNFQITLVKFINYILDIFNDISKNGKFSEFNKDTTKKSYTKILSQDIININKSTNYLSKKYIQSMMPNSDPFIQFDIFIKDYEKMIYTNQTTPQNIPDNYEIDIQKYLNKKLQALLAIYDMFDFGSLKELFSATDNFSNASETIQTGGFLNIKEKIMKSFSSITTKKNQYTQPIPQSTKPIVSIFDPRISWATFKENSKYVSDEETIFDVINNTDKYSILPYILSSISISENMAKTENVKYILEFLNAYIFIPSYGKKCYNTSDTVLTNVEQPHKQSKTIFSTLSRLVTKKPKNIEKTIINKLQSIEIMYGIRVEHILKLLGGIGLEHICTGLQSGIISADTISKFDVFIGKIFTLDFKIIRNIQSIKNTAHNTSQLLFLYSIIQMNMDKYIMQKIDEFQLYINNYKKTQTQNNNNNNNTSDKKMIFDKIHEFLKKYESEDIDNEFVQYEIFDKLKIDKNIYKYYNRHIIDLLNLKFNCEAIIHKPFNIHTKELCKIYIKYFLTYYEILFSWLSLWYMNYGIVNTINSEYFAKCNTYLISRKNILDYLGLELKDNIMFNHQLYDPNVINERTSSNIKQFLHFFEYNLFMTSNIIEEFCNINITKLEKDYYVKYDGNKNIFPTE